MDQVPRVNVTRRLTFAAGHILVRPEWDQARNREVFGACSGDHGHNYELEVTVSGSIDEETGMVINLREVDRIVKVLVIQDVDHRHLNRDVPWLEGCLPTTENVASAIWRRLEGRLPSARLERVRLKETENNVVEVERGCAQRLHISEQETSSLKRSLPHSRCWARIQIARDSLTRRPESLNPFATSLRDTPPIP
jgi:6-pyruvoyltetrahydropterin/6-carboxytetrahydropterin synthase